MAKMPNDKRSPTADKLKPQSEASKEARKKLYRKRTIVIPVIPMQNYLSGYNRKKRVPKKAKQRCRKTQTAKYQFVNAKYLISLIFSVMMKEYEGIYEGI